MFRAFFLFIIFAYPAYSQDTRSYDWDTDLDHLAKELPEKHYDLFAVKSEAEFLSGLEKIKATKNTMTDYQVAVKVQQLIAGLGDSHTGLNLDGLTDKDKVLPLHMYWFSDGLYILHTTQENSGIQGHRIISLNGIPIETVADSLSTLVTQDNPAIMKMYLPRLLTSLENLQAFGFAEEDKVILGLADADGNFKRHTVEPAVMTRGSRVSVEIDSLPFCFKNENLLFTENYFVADRIYYIQYNKCWSRELEIQYGNQGRADQLPSFAEFEEKIFRTLNPQSVDKIIFDIRNNGGGYSLQGTQFIEKLAEYLAENPETKVYVVLGRATFSSAILNAMDFKRLTNAVFVGEETAGKPNHFGEVRSFRLPVSGVSVSYSTKYFQRTAEEVDTLTPDVKLETAFPDFIKGIDPVYEWIAGQ